MIYSSNRFIHALVVVFLLVGCPQVLAHSEAPRPLKRLAHPSTLSLEIVPRVESNIDYSDLNIIKARSSPNPQSTTLRHSDSFRLVLKAFEATYHLHLRPNDHLIHPAARVHHYSTAPDGTAYISETKPLIREEILVYEGQVIDPSYSFERLRHDASTLPPLPTSHSAVLGWARIMVHSQGNVEQGIAPVYEGAFSADGITHHISTKDNYHRNRHNLDPVIESIDDIDTNLVIWRESDVMNKEEHAQVSEAGSAGILGCGHDKLSYNTDASQNPLLARPPRPESIFDSPPFSYAANVSSIFSKRQDTGGAGDSGRNFIDTIGDKSGCPTTPKILYMGVAADCRFVTQYGSKDNATKQILNDWNTASSLYKESISVSLGIVELQIMEPSCPTTPDPAIPWNINCGTVLSDRLSLFSRWRGNKGGSDQAGLWHLMSGCPTGTEVGIAWLGTVCQTTAGGSANQVVSGTGVSTSGRTEWQVIAHEIGHNFGAIHDCAEGCTTTDNCCPLSPSSCNANARFIMSPVAQPGDKEFSPCSLGNMCSLMAGVQGQRTNTTCLVDPGDASVQTISLQMCGNGIVEPGEDCDPGTGVESACCNPQTCKFRSGSVCDPQSTLCCTDSCQFAPSTRVCRRSRDAACDVEETCTGRNATCPPDVTKPNGEACGENELKCASGVCTSVARQCQTIGASMGLRDGCPNRSDGTCQISCADPRRSNVCIQLSSMLIDGSPCGFGGICAGGQCRSGSALDTAKAWYTQNLQISIPVTIVAGLFVILILWAIIRSCMRCGNRKRNLNTTAAPSVSYAALRHERLASHDRGNMGHAPRVPSESRPGQHHSTHARSNWVDEGSYNGPQRY